MKILKLTVSGEPQKWITLRQATEYAAKDLIAWSPAQSSVVMRGGFNRQSQRQSILEVPSVIAVKGSHYMRTHKPVTLTNTALFRRDRFRCAYCGNHFSESQLTREHIVPESRGGEDTWTNLISACSPCNRRKGDRTPTEADMPLLFQPWTPSQTEMLVLSNPNVDDEQLNYLEQFIDPASRIYQE